MQLYSFFTFRTKEMRYAGFWQPLKQKRQMVLAWSFFEQVTQDRHTTCAGRESYLQRQRLAQFRGYDDRAVPPTLGIVLLPASEFLQPIPDQRFSPGRQIGCFYVDTGYRKTKKDRTAAQLSSPSWSGDANGSFPSVAWAVGTFKIWLPVTNHAGYTAVRAVIPAWRVD